MEEEFLKFHPTVSHDNSPPNSVLTNFKNVKETHVISRSLKTSRCLMPSRKEKPVFFHIFQCRCHFCSLATNFPYCRSSCLALFGQFNLPKESSTKLQKMNRSRSQEEWPSSAISAVWPWASPSPGLRWLIYWTQVLSFSPPGIWYFETETH